MSLLFNEIIFGPIHSRRLGVSLGVNLLPRDGKLCSFDCVYCECGYNIQGKGKTGMPSREEVSHALELKLNEMKEAGTAPDVITFAGNGEPTLHPSFDAIIDDTILLRNKYFPKAKICVLSNGTLVRKESVFNALNKVDENILKLDSAIQETVRRLDSPNLRTFSIHETIASYKKFNGKLIIQTLFVRGTHNGKTIDNTTPLEIADWLSALEEIKPASVMIYTIDRATPEKNLVKVPVSELKEIAAKVKALGFKTSVSG
ncbi:MAG: radical SAM protein [Bacteroidales bacterium]|nr:radical SAM protein [Bacteroidales bacterium]